jgi:ribosomal protein S18 acetylase RimI-like enzyme
MALFGASRSHDADPPRLQRADASQQRAVLSLLLTGRCHEQDPAVEQFISFARQQSLDISDLWAAWQGGKPVASVLIIAAAGRTAMAFLGPVGQRGLAPVLGDLLAAACAALDPARVHLVQALLDPGQKLEHQACCHARFRDLATLVYMQRDTDGAPDPPSLPVGVSVTTWSEAARDRFRRAILASYEGTMDCPGLLGVRQIDDVIAGHMASGRFAPDQWQALYLDDDPVAVMLLNDVSNRDAVELVYLGLSPRWRGRGLGRVLLQRGLAAARARGVAQMVLAVDQANAPAVRLYQSQQFGATACKQAMIFTLVAHQ